MRGPKLDGAVKLPTIENGAKPEAPSPAVRRTLSIS
jgi:hypothetical protein